MAITAQQVKKLRELTGVGMMDCKKALDATEGDEEKALLYLREQGQAKALKRSSRTAADGIVVLRQSEDLKEAIIVEVNCETDFVARDDNFTEFASVAASCALTAKVDEPAAILALTDAQGQTLEKRREELVQRLGENIQIRRAVYVTSAQALGLYKHGVKIGAIVKTEGGTAETAKDIAVQVVGMNPKAVRDEDISDDMIKDELGGYKAEAEASGKPAHVIEKWIANSREKVLGDVVLLRQKMLKDSSTTVEKFLAEQNATVVSFVRFERGEGIEKEVSNFRDEVMAQVQGS